MTLSFRLGVQTELSSSQRKMCCELSKLKGEEVEEEEQEAAAEASSSFSALQVGHACLLHGFVAELRSQPVSWPVSRVKNRFSWLLCLA